MSEIKCPKCGSNQVTANKKGFSGGKAAAGVVLTGGIGLLAGTIGSNDVIITCLSCANTFKTGNNALQARNEKVKAQAEARLNAGAAKLLKPLGIILLVVLGIIIVSVAIS